MGKISEGFKKLVIHTAENLGGSGGFYLGEERALHLDADWVMIADDDAYPEPNYLEGMQKYIDHHDFQKYQLFVGKWQSTITLIIFIGLFSEVSGTVIFMKPLRQDVIKSRNLIRILFHM